MLPKERRLPRALFPERFSSRPVVSAHMMLFVEEQKDKKLKTKFSFVVSSKVSKKATERNLIKRRAREVVRLVFSAIKDGYLAIFYFKKGATALPFQEMKGEIIFLLNKSNLL